MKPTAKYHSFFYKLILIILVFSITGCSGTGIPSSGSVGGGFINEPRLIGFVSDPDGLPVPNALVGGEDYTTSDGVTSGDFEAFQGQWIPIEAAGYPTGYGKPMGEEQGSPFFTASLTPFHSVYLLEGDENIVLGAEVVDEFMISAAVSGADFSGSPAIVGLAAIQALDVDSRFTDTDFQAGLRLRQAFALQAYDDSWAPIELSADALPIELTFVSPLSPGAVFAVFDPVQGLWTETDLGCEMTETGSYLCQLAKLSPLVGVFDQPQETLAGFPSLFRLSASSLGSLFNFSTLNQGYDDPGMKSAWNKLADWLKSQEDSSGTVDPNDPTLKKLVEDLGNAASKFASKNRNEAGKKALGQAYDAAAATGQQGVMDQMEAEMGEISDELGEKALQESDCGEYEKLLKAAQQIMLTSQNQGLIDQLTKKAEEMADDCDIWAGYIRVYLSVTSNHPAGLPMQGNGGAWMEYHDVQIWTNVDDHVMHGHSKIQQTFSSVTYKKEKPCPQEIIMAGNAGNTTIRFEGFYDGYQFQINSTAPEGSGGTIKQTWHFQKKENDECVPAYDNEFSFSPYYSLVFHGLSSDSPPITLQEILDSSNVTSTMGKQDSLSGTEYISNPDPELGLYPFQKGFITWNLMHRQKKLPLEDN